MQKNNTLNNYSIPALTLPSPDVSKSGEKSSAGSCHSQPTLKIAGLQIQREALEYLFKHANRHSLRLF